MRFVYFCSEVGKQRRSRPRVYRAVTRFLERENDKVMAIINRRILDMRLKSALCPETIKLVEDYKRAVVDLNRLRVRSRK